MSGIAGLLRMALRGVGELQRFIGFALQQRLFCLLRILAGLLEARLCIKGVDAQPGAECDKNND